MRTVARRPIDLQTAAKRLGVHYQTAYKWVRSGRLPATLVRGVYELDPDAVTQFAERRSRPTKPSPRRPRSGFNVLADRMFDQLVDGEEREARRLVGGLLDDGVSLTTIAQEVLGPALARIGAEWSDGRVSISVEHRASAIVERVLGEYNPAPHGRRRGIAVVAALSGDRHDLPTTMAAAALREDNWHVHHLGADVPRDEIVRFCADHPVDLVVLTVTAAGTRGAARRCAAELEAHGLRVLVGRAGARLDVLQREAREAR